MIVEIRITSGDGVPIYLQIMKQVRTLVASGRLAPDEELPAIRVLAEQLTINPNTVARAYRELEREGLLEIRRATGTYVSSRGSPLARKYRLRILAERVDALVVEARQMGFDGDELTDLVRERARGIRGVSGGRA